MALILDHHVPAAIGRHALNVYPLEGFGLLLGWTSTDGATGHVIAALPVGKTIRWYEPAGRFDRMDEALAVAAREFAAWRLHPVGMYCGVDDPDSGDDLDDLVNAAPQRPEAPWLFVCPVFGGELLTVPATFHRRLGKWHEETTSRVRARPASPERNPRRIRTRWNRA